MINISFIKTISKRFKLPIIFLLGYFLGTTTVNLFNSIPKNNNLNNNLALIDSLSKFNSFFITLDKNYYKPIDHNALINIAITQILQNLDPYSTIIPLENNTNVNQLNTKNINNNINNYSLSYNNNKFYYVSNSVSYKVFNNILYIKVNNFNSNVSNNIKDTINAHTHTNITNIVLDLTNNPGGLLTEAIKTSNLFLEHGLIATIPNYKFSTEYNKNLATYVADDNTIDNNFLHNLSIYILVNKNTASAAEIVAGSLQINKKAMVIGEQTLGKNLIQSIFYLQPNFVIKLTTASYVLSNQENISLTDNKFTGVIPNIQINNNILEYTINLINNKAN